MPWRYCSKCDGEQAQISLEEISAVSYDDNAKVPCDHCGADRDDDTPGQRILILLEEVMRLRALLPP